LDASVDEKKLTSFFEKYGEITSCVIGKDKDGKSKKFGFLNFKEPKEAFKAVEENNAKVVDGISSKDVPLYMGKAEKKDDRVQKLKTDFEKKKQESIQKYQGKTLLLTLSKD
jgi:polyadenylate-binding protein